MENETIGAFIIGFFLPLVFAAVIRKRWSSQTKQIVTFALYMVAALFIFLYENQVGDVAGWRGYVDIFAPVVIGGVTGYMALWKRVAAPQIEERTG